MRPGISSGTAVNNQQHSSKKATYFYNIIKEKEMNKTVLIQVRKDTDLLIKDNGIVSIKGNDNEVLSGVPVETWPYPFQVAFPDPVSIVVSPVFKQSTRLVNAVQYDQFFVYGATGGFRWINCSACIPVFGAPQS